MKPFRCEKCGAVHTPPGTHYSVTLDRIISGGLICGLLLMGGCATLTRSRLEVKVDYQLQTARNFCAQTGAALVAVNMDLDGEITVVCSNGTTFSVGS